MTNMFNKYDYDWANEYIVLYESADELIVLHRNIMRNEEFILLSGQSSADSSTEAKYLLDFVEYDQLIPHQFKIRGYHKRKDNFQLFKAFFGQSISDFFNTIRSF